jgi:hypothetical protein
MFEASKPFALFDYFRVPYSCLEEEPGTDTSAGLAWVKGRAGGRRLFWSASPFAPSPAMRPDFYFVTEIPVFATVLPEAAIQQRVGQLGGTWRPEMPIRDRRGTAVASIWREADGSVFLPFDPAEVISACLTEAYKTVARQAPMVRLESMARRSYYRLRPFLPRPVQMRLRRSYSHVQEKTDFPGWPIETALHDFYGLMLALAAEIAGEPVPTLAAWPRKFDWALVLTHDVEGPVGLRNVARLVKLELRHGYRSSWNFVPENEGRVEDVFLQELRASGFEVGVHGLLHDGRDISSFRMLKRRLPRMRKYAEQWQATGFRSPATLRSWELMPLLGFDYDSSYSDTAPFEPQPGGCCSWLPYMIRDLVELPITLPQDHTLFELLGHDGATLWLEKAHFLRDRGGMALMLTHPDYIDNQRLLKSYSDFLDEFADDSTAWRALPREVSAWWRRRAATTIRRVDDEWQLDGPASREGAIKLVGPSLVTA